MPRIPLIGVRSSWDILARNSSFALPISCSFSNCALIFSRSRIYFSTRLWTLFFTMAGSHGEKIYSSAPASNALTSVFSSIAVFATIGISAYLSCCFISRITSNPSITGMQRSRRTICTFCCSSCSIACFPFSASRIWYSSLKISANEMRSTSMSSTMSIVSCLFISDSYLPDSIMYHLFSYYT